LYVDSSEGKILHLQLQSGARLLSTIYTASDMEEHSQVNINTAWIESLAMVSWIVVKSYFTIESF